MSREILEPKVNKKGIQDSGQQLDMRAVNLGRMQEGGFSQMKVDQGNNLAVAPGASDPTRN